MSSRRPWPAPARARPAPLRPRRSRGRARQGDTPTSGARPRQYRRTTSRPNSPARRSPPSTSSAPPGQPGRQGRAGRPHALTVGHRPCRPERLPPRTNRKATSQEPDPSNADPRPLRRHDRGDPLTREGRLADAMGDPSRRGPRQQDQRRRGPAPGRDWASRKSVDMVPANVGVEEGAWTPTPSSMRDVLQTPGERHVHSNGMAGHGQVPEALRGLLDRSGATGRDAGPRWGLMGPSAPTGRRPPARWGGRLTRIGPSPTRPEPGLQAVRPERIRGPAGPWW